MKDFDPLGNRFEPSTQIERARGAWLYQTDGERVLDMVLGCCCNVHGHAHPYIVEQVTAALREQTNVGDRVNQTAGRLARRILTYAKKDLLRFVNSGSEAVQVALRAARASHRNARHKLIRFTGHYHGWLDQEIVRFTPERYVSYGLDDTLEDSTICLEWNNVETLEAAFARHGEEAYALICEPTLCHAGTIPAAKGWLEQVRELCTRYHVPLIFDECITGFRLALGGAQEYYGVDADIVCYSKTISAGIPIGVACLSGPSADAFAEAATFQAATYDANAISVASASACIDLLERGEFYANAQASAEALRRGLSARLSQAGIPHCIQGHDCMFQVFFTGKPRIRSWEDFSQNVNLDRHVRFVTGLNQEGVYAYKGDLHPDPRRRWYSQLFLSAAHGPEEVEFFLECAEKVIADVA